MSAEGAESATCGYQLTPVSNLARSIDIGLSVPLKGPSGLKLRDNGVTKLGRKVSKQEGYCFPPNWVQVSSRHCEIKSDGHVIVVTDTSANGTFVNNKRVPKHGSISINEGDILRLSIPLINEPAENVLE